MRIRVYYEDTDCGGIIYHTNYIKYCERARSDVFFRAGVLPSSGTCGFVVSAIEAKFLGFARLGDVLEVRTEVQKLGKVQVILRQRIYKLVDSALKPSLESSALGEVCIFEAIVRLGYVDVINQSPAQIPAEFLALLRALDSGDKDFHA